jgi:hypothetical protein
MRLVISHQTSDTEKVQSLLASKITDGSVEVEDKGNGISVSTFTNRYQGYTKDAEKAIWVAENRMRWNIVSK